MPLGGQTGGLPDLADGVRAEADDPTGEQDLEGLEDLGAEAIAERLYQRGEAGDKLIHRADLRAVTILVCLKQPQDTESAGDGPLFLHHQRLLLSPKV